MTTLRYDYFNFWHQFLMNFIWNFLIIFLYPCEYTALGIKYKPLSLAHGFPDFLGPKYITDALINAASNPDYLLNQYTRGFVSLFYYLMRIMFYFTFYTMLCLFYWTKNTTFQGSSTIGSSIVDTLFKIDQSKNWSIQWNFGYIRCLRSTLLGHARVCIAFKI